MSALVNNNRDMELAGILASGSERSHSCARQYKVPLYTYIDQLPDDIDAACVVISSEIGGGKGTDIAMALLERKISVLQEHPIHHDELIKLFRAAQKHGVVHKMNTLYPYVHPIRQFLAVSKALLQEHKPLFIEGACSTQLKISFLDIIGRVIGKIRPWEFQSLPNTRIKSDAPIPFRTIQGTIGGVPVIVRLQNQLHFSDPDNHCHLYHQLTLATSVGSLSLVDTHGPIVWRPVSF